MLSKFRNKNKTQSAAFNKVQDRIAKNIVEWCILLQQRWATFMQSRMERLSGNGKLIVLSLFCFIAGGLSIYFIANSLIGSPSIAIRTSRIVVPLNAVRSLENNLKSANVITKQEYNQIVYFTHYMDSLARSPSGKLIYDSILKQRPGLKDSASFVENIYQSQNK